MTSPGRVLATAPVRVADVGGWTDTWFGSPGQVCSVAVGPGVTVAVDPEPSGTAAVVVDAPDIGVRFTVAPDPGGSWSPPRDHEHPLLAHAVASVAERAGPAPHGLQVTISSAVPAGASLGTSAAVLVALVAALEAAWLAPSLRRAPAELAVAAHEVETVRAGREAGVQDHWSAALGGVAVMAVGPYPRVRHRPVAVPAGATADLAERLVTVVFGSHDSSAVHRSVITDVLGCSGAAHDRARRALSVLSALAARAASALANGDLEGWGAVLADATEAQRRLHPDLIGPAHRQAIEVAAAEGAVGWKVNGAGGSGGSLTLLARRGGAGALRSALAAADPAWVQPRLDLAGGVTVRSR